MSPAPRTSNWIRPAPRAALRVIGFGLAARVSAAGPVEIPSHDPPAGTRVESTAPKTNADTPSYKVKISNNNLIGITISNYGFYGNNFVSRSPSFEYPLGAGFEHMVRGGLWIGGITD